MDLLFKLAEFCGWSLLLGFFGVVLWKILSGEISLEGLLDSFDHLGKRSYSPGRAQLLIVTAAVAAKYVMAVIQNPHRESLPGLPVELVAALGGSQAIYLGGKAWTTFLPLLKKLK